MHSSHALQLIEKLNRKYEKAQTLNIFQHAIQALTLLEAQVRTGGYIQLIQNGYGEYIFENAWPEAYRYMQATKLADNLNQAKEIYMNNKEALEKELSLEEFTKLYDAFPQFDPLHTRYINIIEEELETIKNFIHLHPEYFKI